MSIAVQQGGLPRYSDGNISVDFNHFKYLLNAEIKNVFTKKNFHMSLKNVIFSSITILWMPLDF